MPILMVILVPRSTFLEVCTKAAHSHPCSSFLSLKCAPPNFQSDVSRDVEGISVQGAHIFLSLFADDTDIFSQATSECIIDSIVNELTEFGSHSGCKPNVSKNTMYPAWKSQTQPGSDCVYQK